MSHGKAHTPHTHLHNRRRRRLARRGAVGWDPLTLKTCRVECGPMTDEIAIWHLREPVAVRCDRRVNLGNRFWIIRIRHPAPDLSRPLVAAETPGH